ncbi:GIY-YIG catalytic domain-containing endonuclease [Paramecium bursaria Chlorella virus CvsA1]|nr:GIY-YIG catalytic domain-containing endonuclease [Paramecium bursaria Chlorella virus CvsA1]
MGNHAYFYIWTHKTSGMQYVGVTTRSVEERIKEHCKKSSGCTKLRNAIQKHGIHAFDVEYFEWCDEWDLAYIEMILVDELETLSPKGFNLKKGGGKYGSLSNETKKKLSGENNHMYGKGHLISGEKNGMFGKQHTEETKKKLSVAKSGEKNGMFGKHHAEESKKKLSNANSGEKNGMYGNGYLISGENNPMFGKHHTEETKKKLSVANSGENNPMFGKHLTDETKRKISDAHMGENNPKSKKVYQYDSDGNYIRSFGSCREAGRFLGKSHKYITACARGDREPICNFLWSFVEIMK